MTGLDTYLEPVPIADDGPSRLIDVSKEPIRGVLNILLSDKTTKGNIVWGTDAYADRGHQPSDQITMDSFFSGLPVELVPRIEKDLRVQTNRTRRNAEVFTPVWICNLMNNHCDEMWFGRNDVFNSMPETHECTFTEGKISFPEGRTWKGYVDSRRLEITCGEAPFLVSRYDASHGGAVLPLYERIGVFDRKMRIVNENASSDSEWLDWAIRALQSCYGYEFQGDNLLIARINVLLSFCDYYSDHFQTDPPFELVKKVAGIIAWNLWQMDGLGNNIPFSKPPTTQCSLFMFGDTSKSGLERGTKPSLSKIYDWRRDNSVIFDNCRKRGKMDKKLFDYVIGNPPYQKETTRGDSENNQKSRTNIFHYFQIASNEFAGKGSVMIYPGGRWIQRSGKGVRDFGLTQINDKHLSELHFYPNSSDLFPKVDLDDGISIVVMDYGKEKPGFDYFYHGAGDVVKVKMDNPGESIMALNPADIPIAEKIRSFMKDNGYPPLHNRIESRSLFGIESDFISKKKFPVRLYNEGDPVDYETEIKLYVNDKAGVSGRAKWFITSKESLGDSIQYLDKWKVIASSAHPAGAYGRERQLELIDNHSAFGRSKIAFGLFNTEKEAQNFYKYLDSTIIHYALLLVDESLSTLALNVPDIGDYSDDNGIIDFSRDIDEQLIQLLLLTEEDVEHILEVMGKNGGE